MADLSDAISNLRRLLPRVFELRDAAGGSHPDDFFRDFEASTIRIPAKRVAFERLERQLSALDISAWHDLKGRAVGELQKRRPGRGWQSLFDLLNEAKGAEYLASLGCRNIRFIPRATKKTPDLEADLDGQRVLCEVKTLNISENEASHRRRVDEGQFEAREVSQSVQEMLVKLSTTLEAARLQLETHDIAGGARRVIFLVIHFDDWVGDYQPEYLAQIDEHLAQRPLLGAQLVISPANNLFARRFTMNAATVWEQ